MPYLTFVKHSSLQGFWNPPDVRAKAKKNLVDGLYGEFILKNKRIEEDYQQSRWHNLWKLNAKINKLKEEGHI